MWLVCLIGLQRVVWDWLHLPILIISKFQLPKNVYLLCIYLSMSDLRSCRQKISFWLKSQKHCLFFFFLLALRPSPSILHFLYRHSSELLLNLRSDPATCYLHPSLPDPLLHNSPRGQRFCYVSTQATDSRREIHKPCVGAEKKEEKKRSAPVLTHLLKTE